MAYYVAGAVLVGSLYGANEGRKSRKEAENTQRTLLAQQASDQAAMRLELSKQTAEYAKQGASLEQQAQTARQQFETSQANYATNKLDMEKKAKEVQAAADEERRKAAAAEASALKARTRGGRRSLLSGERMDAELGVATTLNSGNMGLM
jgi:septal ring factor EnvC (AmiA/AmiB activator)